MSSGGRGRDRCERCGKFERECGLVYDEDTDQAICLQCSERKPMDLYIKKKRGEYVPYKPPKLYQFCEDCGGNGQLDCEECGGGVVKCEECGGTGYADEEKTERCPACDEDYNDPTIQPGERKCGECDGESTLKCTSCKGEGYRPIKAEEAEDLIAS